MIDSPIKFMKEQIIDYLSQIENEKFRFFIFIKLSEDRVFLLNIYQSNEGFLEQFKGIQLRISSKFIEIIKEKDEYESNGIIETDHPFLYGEFIKGSTFYMKKIFSMQKVIGFMVFVVKKDNIPESIKGVLDSLLDRIKSYLFDLYVDIRDDIERKYFAINTLNVIKNIRPKTFYHSFRVADLAVAIADKLGLSKNSVRKLCYAAFIHDIGEMYVPNDIFYKKGALTEEEIKVIKQHPHFLKVIFSKNPLMEDIVNIAYYHHERVDGKGYLGIKGESLPIESKILSLCETIDGLYTDRPDRKGLDIKKIISIVKELKGKAFDSEVVDASLEILEKYYISRNFEFLKANHISNIGKPIVVILEKEGNIRLIQGVVEYITSNIIGIELYQSTKELIEAGKPVKVQLFFFDLMFNFKCTVISSSENYINVLIKDSEDSVFGSLYVFWELDAIAIPLKSALDKNLKQKGIQPIKLKTKRFGSKSLTAKTENPPVQLNIGDTVLLTIKPLKEKITIPAMISNVIKEDNIYTIYFEYLNLPEKTDALIHKAIYYKQSQLNKL